MKVFQQRLCELRRQFGYTQRQIAQKLNIAQPSYIRYENGTAEPKQEILIKISNIYDVSTDYLLGKTEY